MDNRKILGFKGEQAVKKYLINQGWLFIEQNRRLGESELDLIFQAENKLIFIEAKTRQQEYRAKAMAPITATQTRKISSAIIDYCLLKKWPLERTRLDLIVVIPNSKRTASLIIYQNILS